MPLPRAAGREVEAGLGEGTRCRWGGHPGPRASRAEPSGPSPVPAPPRVVALREVMAWDGLGAGARGKRPHPVPVAAGFIRDRTRQAAGAGLMPTTPLGPQDGGPPRSLPLGVPTGACKKEGREVRGTGAPFPLMEVPTRAQRARLCPWRPHRGGRLLKGSPALP